MTAICINKDFLLLNSRAAEPDKSSGKPRMDGISEVKDSLWKSTNSNFGVKVQKKLL